MSSLQEEQVIISNLLTIIHQSSELIKQQPPTIYYSDFYQLYTSQYLYLRSLNWEDEESKKLVQRLPKLPQPLLTSKLLVALIPMAFLLITPFSWILLPLYVVLLSAIYYMIKSRNKRLLREINQISQALLHSLRVKRIVSNDSKEP